MTIANEQQITYWNEVAGPKWVNLTDDVNAQISPIGLHAMDRAAVQNGERILDVGCGCGQTSLSLAERVGSGGHVLGVDISGPMLKDARRRANAAQISNVEFEQADAQTFAFDSGSFDVAFSRFGIMFFDDPVAAFSNIRKALAKGGRLQFACWQPLDKNPWMLLPAMAAAKHVEMPPPPAADAPGPYALKDSERVRRILSDSGYRDIGVEAHEGEMRVGAGRPLAEIVPFLQQMGPAGAALREATDAMRQAAARGMEDDLAPYYVDDALVMEFATWIVHAEA